MNPKLPILLNDTIRRWHGREHYDYQKQITHAIIEAYAKRLTGETIEIPIELPRQCGKTTALVDVVEFLLARSKFEFGIPLRVGIFAPQKEQATTDFERLKEQIAEISPSLRITFKTKVDADIKMPQKWNSKSVKLYTQDGKKLGEVYIFPISKTSNPESKTFDLIIVEEAQDVIDQKMKDAIFPMGASTNAPRIFIGTAGTRICYFKRQLDNNPRAIRIKIEEVFKHREDVYKKTGDENHLLYKRYVDHEVETHGLDSDYIQRQYFGKWIIGQGQFTTNKEMDALVGKHKIIKESDKPCYVGIDTAKSPDQTVVTVIEDNPDEPRKSKLCGWLTLKGENYEDQFDYIKKYLSYFTTIKSIAIDATGQADFMPDKFERNTAYNIIRFKFSAESKDVLYKNLLQVVKNKLTELPDEVMNGDYLQFRQEMLDLQKEYKGRFLSCHHPEGDKMHDDYCDSWALAEHAKTEVIKNEPNLTFI